MDSWGFCLKLNNGDPCYNSAPSEDRRTGKRGLRENGAPQVSESHAPASRQMVGNRHSPRCFHCRGVQTHTGPGSNRARDKILS